MSRVAHAFAAKAEPTLIQPETGGWYWRPGVGIGEDGFVTPFPDGPAELDYKGQRVITLPFERR